MNVFLNGRIVPVEEATVSVLDHGFLYGAGLFETMRTAGGKPMFWAEHMTRLREAADEIGLPIPWDDAELQLGVCATRHANELSEAYVRLTVTRGPGAPGPSGRSCTEPTLLIMVKELVLPSATVYAEGRDLLVLDTRRNTPETPQRRKSLNYLNSLLAYRELELRGGGEGIQLTQDGYVAEGAVSNLFFVVDGALWTPALDTGILPGITRAWALTTARAAGVEVCERRFTLDDVLPQATEAFTTSSVTGIMPIRSVEGHPIGDGRPGPLTLVLQKDWNLLL